jgi:hypothetical protein
LSVDAAWQQETLIQNDLKIVVLAYNLHTLDMQKPPAKAEDLAPYFENDERLLEVLKSGKIQFQYNVPIADIIKTKGIANTILAYEKDLPTKGGYAAFADGNVKQLTAEEFKKTALAGKK